MIDDFITDRKEILKKCENNNLHVHLIEKGDTKYFKNYYSTKLKMLPPIFYIGHPYTHFVMEGGNIVHVGTVGGVCNFIRAF